MITDNVIVAYEALHTMKTQQKGRIRSMAQKFCRAKVSKWLLIKNLWETYELASGHYVTKQKTSLFFSPNTREFVKKKINDSVGVNTCSNLGKYLGLPSTIGKSKY